MNSYMGLDVKWNIMVARACRVGEGRYFYSYFIGMIKVVLKTAFTAITFIRKYGFNFKRRLPNGVYIGRNDFVHPTIAHGEISDNN